MLLASTAVSKRWLYCDNNIERSHGAAMSRVYEDRRRTARERRRDADREVQMNPTFNPCKANAARDQTNNSLLLQGCESPQEEKWTTSSSI